MKISVPFFFALFLGAASFLPFTIATPAVALEGQSN